MQERQRGCYFEWGSQSFHVSDCKRSCKRAAWHGGCGDICVCAIPQELAGIELL